MGPAPAEKRRGTRGGGPPRRDLRHGRATGKTTQGSHRPRQHRAAPTRPGTPAGLRPSKSTQNTLLSEVLHPPSHVAQPRQPWGSPARAPTPWGEPPLLHLLPPVQHTPGSKPGSARPAWGQPQQRRPSPAPDPARAARRRLQLRTGPRRPGSGTRRGTGAGAPPRPLPHTCDGRQGERAAHTHAGVPRHRSIPALERRPSGILPQLGGGRRGPQDEANGVGPLARHGNTMCDSRQTRLRRGSGWGVRYPKAPSRIAREGFLTEGASLPPHRARGGAGSGTRRERSLGRRIRSAGPGGACTKATQGQRRALAVGAVSKGTARAASGHVRLLVKHQGLGKG